MEVFSSRLWTGHLLAVTCQFAKPLAQNSRLVCELDMMSLDGHSPHAFSKLPPRRRVQLDSGSHWNGARASLQNLSRLRLQRM